MVKKNKNKKAAEQKGDITGVEKTKGRRTRTRSFPEVGTGCPGRQEA